MQSRIEKERHQNLITTNRPDSSQLVDLHVYIIPKKVWKNRQNLAENIAINQAVSVGFVRIPESLTIHDLRRYIIDTCDDDQDFPKEFIYLRSVGRCLTKVKQQQEKELKVKNFRPPTTMASEIYILDESHDDNSLISIRQNETPMSSESWIRPLEVSMVSYPIFDHNSVIFQAKLNSRDLTKLRQEQERLYYRQLELARQRHEIENQYHKEQKAAVKIQTAFRNYRHRQSLKEQEINDIARELAPVKLSNRLEELRIKRLALEDSRELIVRRMQQLHNQINSRRREEKVLWREKYFIEKNQITKYEEQNNTLPVKKNSNYIQDQLEQAKDRLDNTTKIRQQAEYECRLLRQELQQISSNLNALERYRIS